MFLCYRNIIMELAMLRLLSIIDEHHSNSSSKDGISTRQLLQEVASNEFHSVIKEAAAEGYINRRTRRNGRKLLLPKNSQSREICRDLLRS